MRGFYGKFMLNQAIRCHPPLIEKACERCAYWDETVHPPSDLISRMVVKMLIGPGNCLCKKWQLFTKSDTQCDFFTSKSCEE